MRSVGSTLINCYSRYIPLGPLTKKFAPPSAFTVLIFERLRARRKRLSAVALPDHRGCTRENASGIL